jgi:DnaK suppressor protein
MNQSTDEYKRLLQAEERRLLGSLKQAQPDVQDLSDPSSAIDWSDASVADEEKSTLFQEADGDLATLNQVRDALKRIENGTFGKCVVDGGPIDEKRLRAVPWTPYCLKHEQLLEKKTPPRISTL